MTETPSPNAEPGARFVRPGIPGHYVVLGMLATGLLATATIFIYWELHTRPFRPLTEAIGREWRHSLPKVEGGRHKGGPMTLRIAMRVPFSPDETTAETQRVVNRMVELAHDHSDWSRFEVLQIHLLQLAPERIAKEAVLRFEMSQLGEGVPFPHESEAAVPGPVPQ